MASPCWCSSSRGAGQGTDRHIGERLVAQHVVRVMVGQQHLDHRLSVTVAIAWRMARRSASMARCRSPPRRVGDDERGIDDVAAVGLGEIVGAAFQQPGVLGDLPGLER
jgi:hypothetical protein